ncbi:MAG: alpha/beta hydrolase [Planctomycetota bacterium]
MNRLALILLTIAAAMPAVAMEPFETIGLWGDEPLDGVYENRGSDTRPDGWLHGVTHPVITLYRPVGDRPLSAAVVVFPGGGYGGQAIDKEGHFVARWLAERGVVGVVVAYRCGGSPHRAPIPLRDAERAVRLTHRWLAERGAGRPTVGVIGFSAGGHLAASVATKGAKADPEASDPLKRFSARPDFAALVYPVISMRPGVTHRGSRRNLLGDKPTEEQIAAWSIDEHVSADTPSTFLVHSVDDRSVPIENARRYAEACRRVGVPVEAHEYPSGGHGYGMWATEGEVARWSEAYEGWLSDLGVIDR